MQDPVRAEMHRQLALAQDGDEEALRRVSIYVFEKYKSRLNRLYSADPAISMEDMRSTFFLGILDHILKLDARGCPFYHAGQRGYWAVQSELRSIKRHMSWRALPDFGPEDERLSPAGAIEDRYVDRTQGDFREVVIDALDADSVVRIVANTRLSSRARQALDIIISGEAGDPTELGFNQKLAEAMGVSPQRASQVMADVREQFTEVL